MMYSQLLLKSSFFRDIIWIARAKSLLLKALKPFIFNKKKLVQEITKMTSLSKFDHSDIFYLRSHDNRRQQLHE